MSCCWWGSAGGPCCGQGQRPVRRGAWSTSADGAPRLALPHQTGHFGATTGFPVQRPFGSLPSPPCGSQVQVVSLPHSGCSFLQPFPWHWPLLLVTSFGGAPVVGQLSVSPVCFQ